MQGLLTTPVMVGSMRATAIIDTGGQASIANEAFRMAVSHHISAKDVMTDAITGATLDVEYGSRMVTPPIRIGDVVIRQARITTGDLHIFKHWEMVKNPVMLIGMDVLGLFDTIIIDYKRHELQVLMRNVNSFDERPVRQPARPVASSGSHGQPDSRATLATSQFQPLQRPVREAFCDEPMQVHLRILLAFPAVGQRRCSRNRCVAERVDDDGCVCHER